MLKIGVSEGLIQEGADLLWMDLPVLLVVLISYELDGVVGLEVLEHSGEVRGELLKGELLEDDEVDLEDEADVSGVLLCPSTADRSFHELEI